MYCIKSNGSLFYNIRLFQMLTRRLCNC